MSSQLNLREPDQMDWNNYAAGSTYRVPPPALGADGKPIVYSGQIPSQFADSAFTATDEGYRAYVIDPITITRSGNGADGYPLRFTRVNTKKFVSKKTNKPTEASSVGNYLRAAGITAKPQKNAEYDAAVRATAGKTVSFTIDWEARNKDTAEQIRGYANFPNDPDRPGQKKAILKAGDTYLDEAGQPQTVKSEVLFANARVRFFQDPGRK